MGPRIFPKFMVDTDDKSDNIVYILNRIYTKTDISDIENFSMAHYAFSGAVSLGEAGRRGETNIPLFLYLSFFLIL